MPSIMSAFDALCENKLNDNETDTNKSNIVPKKVHQVNNFTNLSANVVKILSNVPDEEINKNFSSEDSLCNKHRTSKRFINTTKRSPEKVLQKSTENLGNFSLNLQKMLSNLPDSDLVINTNVNEEKKQINKIPSFIHSNRQDYTNDLIKVSNSENILQDINIENDEFEMCNSKSDSDLKCNVNCQINEEIEFTSKPLGSYLHTSATGIASRTPVGRKNLGKFLQVFIFCSSI